MKSGEILITSGCPPGCKDNVRRGAELVGGQGGAAPDFPFAMLHRLRRWKNGRSEDVFDGGQLVARRRRPRQSPWPHAKRMNENHGSGKVGYNRFLLFVAGLGGLLYGVDVGIISGALPYLEATFKDTATGKVLDSGQLSFIVAAVMLGTVISTLFCRDAGGLLRAPDHDGDERRVVRRQRAAHRPRPRLQCAGLWEAFCRA